MFKLAHISDIHLGPLPALSFRELASKRITGFVNWHRNRRKHLYPNALNLVLAAIRTVEPDHLAITGDMVNLASGAEILAATEWLRLAGTPENVTVVPGNHDAYVPGAYDRTMCAWHNFVRGDNTPDVWDEDRRLFPAVRRRGQVALIGCSTALATPPFAASGFFGDKQAKALTEQLKRAGDEGLFRCVMIHHPPVRGATALHKRMIGISRFGEALEEAGAELVLHGHTHLDTVYRLKGKTGSVPVVGIASASQGPNGHNPPAGFNLFEIEGEAGRWQVKRKRHALNRSGTAVTLVEETDFSSP